MSDVKALDELRNSSHLDDNKWTLEKGEIVTVIGSRPNDLNAVNWGERWRKIADDIEAEIAERYMLLPVDANNEPIHVGDVMEQNGKRIGTVTAVGERTEARAWVLPYGKNVSVSYIASGISHVKPDPLKELLSELANEVWEASITCQTTWSDSGLDGIEERYADRIRELLPGGDA